MPNPVKVLAVDNAKVWSSKRATQAQRFLLTKDGEDKPRHIFEVPNKPAFSIDNGWWWVLHETKLGGRWVKGRGRSASDYKAEFDDNPTGGDNDFNDAVIWFRTDLLETAGPCK